MKAIIATAAGVAAIAMPTHAETYTYKCHGGGIVKVDENSGTLTWRGTTFRDLKQVEGGKVTWQATNNGITAELSTATKGVADLTIGKDNFDCQMVRQKTSSPLE